MAEKKATKKIAKKAPAKKTEARKVAPKKGATKKVTTNLPAGKAGKSNTFAVIATGGKQYVVHEGDFLNIEKIEGNHKEGGKVEFKEVMLVDDGKSTKVGEPIVSGAKVTAEFVESGRDKKISVIRFRSKSRYFKNRGHRQPYTRVKITKIV